jgi:hypothetical protein
MTRVEITIDQVVLRGVPPEQAAAVVESFQRRLSELAAADPSRVAALADADSPHGPVTDHARPVQVAGPGELGEHTATAVWGAVSGVGDG